ncbi:DUF882 domain-containing protein [Paraburkholderia sp. EG287A]|uniref:DUF882 domain-containing protein n=1 Tax=Paraburkholderia sp. EG287A TaxID=3237012 RepID=UPI0034D25519
MMDRRQFLKAGLGLAAATMGGGLLPFGFESLAHAEAASQFVGIDLLHGTRTLNLVRPENHERLSIEYMRDGQWCEDAYNRICWFLRDIHAHEYVQMDTRTIAILDWSQSYLKQYGYTQPFEILSGFRSRRTNEKTEGAAKDSQHLYGKAVDVRIPGMSVEYLGKLYHWLAAGGVGIYDSHNFVHVDTGPRYTKAGHIREWRRS